MVSFRKWILALAAAGLFAGLASAQPSCSTVAGSTPLLRSEGFTELTGDIVITCSNTTSAQSIVTVFLNSQVTSRLMPISGGPSNASEVLLLLNEPTSFTPCTTPLTGCASGANTFQGIVNGNTINFFGIPLTPVGTTTTLRITNVRINGNSLAGTGGLSQVNATVTVGAAANPAPTAVVGFVQSGLSASTSSSTPTSFNQCASNTRAAVGPALLFAENFSSSFKTRVIATTSTYSGQGSTQNQNTPGTLFSNQSESGLVVPGFTSTNNATAGLTEYGTRLKAVFNNIPTGVRLFVSTTNVFNAALPVPAPSGSFTPGGSAYNNLIGGTSTGNVPGGIAAGTTIPGFAQLVVNETASDAGSGTGGFAPAVTATDVPSVGNTPIVEIVPINGSATAVWEVINTNPNAQETFRFNTYITYTANVAAGSPGIGTGSVNLSFGPTSTASAAGQASSSLTIPRFIPDASAARNIFTINACRTVLLYPYVTNLSGFDTGLAIANTSTDPFGTSPQAGSCTLNWYQGVNNPANTNTGNIASGSVFVTTASQAVPGFQGYMIATCNFQFAHGFAFISDFGARQLAMGYLALVIPDPQANSNSRAASDLSKSNAGSGENIAH